MGRRILIVAAVTLVALTSIFSVTLSEIAFSVVCKNKPASYRENQFEAICPEPGELEITIRDENNVYRILTQDVSAGSNSVLWDGLGWNGERLGRKYYEVCAVLRGVSGAEYDQTFNLYIEYSDQALIFALPSSSTAYTEEAGEWFIEFKCVLSGNFIAEFRRSDEPDDTEPVLCASRPAKPGRINTVTLKELLGKKVLDPGEYTVTCRMEDAPGYTGEFRLSVREGKSGTIPVTVTGEIMPSRDDPDDVIWEKMTAPAVVIDIRAYDHQKVWELPDKTSRNLGTLHGQSQTLKVLSVEGEWTKVGAWNHETADYIEGWVPTDVLKVVIPETDFGLLIDKQKQTLTLFRNGDRIETLLISTGLATENAPEQETAAGSFLTESHRVDFSTNGLKYDYVIRYDGGNLLHQIPYAHGGGKKDFSPGTEHLGEKASHGCIRIQAEPGKNGINAYWLWTHIPKNTRVIILED